MNKLETSKTSSNLKVTQCVNNVFNSPKNLVSNSGFITLFIILIIFIIIFIIFCKKGTQLLKEKIDEIIYNKFDKKPKIDKSNNINNYKIKKEEDLMNKSNKIKIKSKTITNTKGKIPKKSFNKKEKTKNEYIKKNKESKKQFINFNNSNNKNIGFINKNFHKKTLKENLYTKRDNNNNNLIIQDAPDKENDYELNTLEYIQAIKYDKRSCCEYYSSLLKNKQLFLFTFCSFNDYNSGIIKKFIFFLSFALHYTISALFFNDETLHQIYEDEGRYN